MKKRFFAFLCAVVCSIGMFGVGCKKAPEGEITVYMPDGAPALAFAGLMHEDTAEDGVSYYVTNAAQIASKVSYNNMEDNADFCVLPLTAATAKVGNGERYQMVGAVTHGNLYMISKNADITYSVDNLSSLIGKKVGVLQLASTPGMMFKSMLKKNGVAYNDLTGGGELAADKINLTPIVIPEGAKPAQILNGMIGQGVNVFVMAEPAVTALKNGGFVTVGDVQALYDVNGFTQAVLVAKKSLLETHTDWVKDFLDDINNSADWALSQSGETLVNAVQTHMEDSTAKTSLNAATLGGEVVARSGVRFEATSICKAKTEDFLQIAKSVESKTAIPNENFYWIG
ncbi:MAG: ABC transporter substrate-binding protein [Clostridiales bacterium]|nr:ABC transporter substrate-binding protein [Clostridiales bacterium]